MFEIHLSVPPDEDATLSKKMKTLRLENVLKTRNSMGECLRVRDAFTVQRAATFAEAVYVMEQVKREIALAGVAILREKIECAPWLVGESEVLYWETHLRVAGLVEPLYRPACRFLWSRDPESDRHWITVRSRPRGSRPWSITDHYFEVNDLVSFLVRSGIAVVRAPEHEAVIIDTRPEHDAEWER